MNAKPEKKRYVIKGTISNVEMKIANTSEGDKDYGVAKILTKTKSGKDRTIPVMTFYPTGVDFLFKVEEGSKVEVFGTFKNLKGTNGVNRFFEIIGKHVNKEKKEKNTVEGIEL